MEKRISVFRSTARILLTALAAVGFLAVCALSTTPLLQYNVGQDAAFFRLVGKGMTQGMLPYRGFFDMKVPYLFLMEYLGQLLFPGRTGAFLLECVCLFVTILLKIAYFLKICTNCLLTLGQKKYIMLVWIFYQWVCPGIMSRQSSPAPIWSE